jgi:hypothetical protein
VGVVDCAKLSVGRAAKLLKASKNLSMQERWFWSG